MTTSRNFIVAATLAGILSVNAASAETMKPLHAIIIDVGSKHGVGYFLSDNGTCKLVLALAEALSADDVTNFVETRLAATIDAGKTTRFDTAEGKSLEFACQDAAQTMSVKALEQVANASTGG
jgi:hypothetical protein